MQSNWMGVLLQAKDTPASRNSIHQHIRKASAEHTRTHPHKQTTVGESEKCRSLNYFQVQTQTTR